MKQKVTFTDTDGVHRIGSLDENGYITTRDFSKRHIDLVSNVEYHEKFQLGRILKFKKTPIHEKREF